MHRSFAHWLLLLALVGCGHATPSRTPPPSPSGSAVPAPTGPHTAAPVRPTPAPAGRWQPPIPTPHGQPLPTPTVVPGTEVVRLTLESFTLSIHDTGLATLTEGAQRITLTLALTEQTQLLTAVAATPIETMAPTYIESFPEGAMVDIPHRTLTIPGRGTVELFGDAGAPADLIALENQLGTLAYRVQQEGWYPPAPVVSYVLNTLTTTARLDLDRQGTIRMHQQVVGTLPPAEWATVSAMVSPQAFAPWAERYDPPNDQRTDQAWSATIIYSPPGEPSYGVRIGTGTVIPPDLLALVTRLTEIYRRYAPPE